MRFETPVPGRRFSCLYFQYNPDLRFSASQRRRQSLFASGFLTIGAMLFVVPSADAQTEVATAAASKAGTAAVAVVKAGAATVAEAIVSTRPADSQPPASNPSSPSSSNNSNSEPKQTEPKDVQKGGEDKKSSDVIKRPAEPEIPPDPDELAATPNEAGMLRMNFQGQPWPDVIRWLKNVSKKSLDWQELPGGYLNISTHREYSVEEARNIINRHLLARGYTIIIREEMMTVEKIDKLNPAMVPRVTAEGLDQRGNYEFVKVSFTLTALVAGQAAEELKPMLSPNGKLLPLAKTN